ncbi:A-kinase anchor protein 12 [Poecilia latipinna]|nr:PREDICTED: A-kinase anchor protein 12-like [Poecilia latipinna]
MGDAQSAPREAKSDAAAAEKEEEEEERSGEVKDVETGQDIDDKVLRNNGQISDINRKAESSTVELNGHCEDEIGIEAAICPDIKVSEPPKEEETPLENEDIHLKKVTEEAEDEQVGHDDLIEMDAKQNDINESFRKFFSNIGLKLTVKRGSTDRGAVPIDVTEEEPSKPEDVNVEPPANEIIEEAQESTDLNMAEEAVENDSTVCQTPTDVTPDDFQEKEDEKTAGTKEDNTSHDAGTSSPLSEDVTSQEDPRPTSPAGLDENASPFKKFFTTGIFSGLRKKKKLEDDEVGQKEEENATQAACDHHHEEDFARAEKELHEEKTEEEKPITTSATAPSIVVNEITNSQEIVQESPLKKLLSGSSFKKRGKKQKGRKSSDAKLSDSGDHVSDQLLSSAESADNKKEETPAEAASGEDGAWFSFKKLVTPQRRKKSSVDHEEGPIPGSKDGPKSAEAEQISDHSTEEGKRRKDSSVSWEAVLCGSGRRRSRKTSDSEDDMPQNGEGSKQNGGSKEPPIGASNELQEILASSPKQTGSPPEDDESSTWRSFKKLVTPKKKVKEEEESTYEAGQDDSAFSIKKLLSGRKTRKSVDVSPEEFGKEVASIDGEDSETPAVVPLSEFDLPETEPVAEKENNIAKDADGEPQIETIEIKEEVQLQDTAPAEPKDIPSHEGALEKEASSAATTDEEPDELTDSSNHQQLSDIPEEGIITETTPASVAEKEAAKDETIAEDLLEITSEAITAPEPADVTLADETEMVSAVSQLSDSSKTSGNTTPVPAEYTIVNTESLLQQVSETITASPKAIPVCLEEQSPERVVCSVSRQILESSVLDQPKMLEIHRGSEATSIKSGLNAEGIDAVNEVAATIHAKSISHLSEDISTEMASEVPKEELDTAEPATDDVCEVNVSELQKDIKDLEITPERQHVVEGAGDVDEAVSIESLTKGEEVAATEEPITSQAENNRRKTDSKEELVVTSVDDTEEVGGKEEDQTVTEEDTETKKQTQNDAVDELEEQVRAETAEVAKVECDIHSPEERSPETIQLTETPSQDLSEETKDNKEPPVAEAKTEQSAEVTEVVKAAATQLEEDLVQTLNTEVSVSENIFTADIDTDESKPVESLPEVTEETEKKEPQNDQSEVTVELESVQAPTLESEEDAAQSLIKEAPVAGDTATERDAEESKQVESLLDVTEEVERNEPETAAAQIDSSKVTEALESAQAPITESEEDAVLSLHKEVSSLPDSSPAEKHTEESKQLESLAEVRDGQEDKESQIDGAQIRQSEDTEGFENAQAPTLESQKDAVVSLDEVSLPDLSPAEKEEPKQEESLTKVTDEQEDKEVKTDVTQTDNAELKEELKSVETPTVTSEEDLVQSLNKEAEADIQDEKQEERDEPEDKEPQTDATQIKELICPEAPILTSEEDAGQSINQSALFLENISSTVTNAEELELLKSLSEESEEQADKERQKIIPTLESPDVTQVSDVKEATDVVQEATNDLQEDILASEESRVEVLGKDATPTDAIPKAETVEEKPKEEPECLIQGIIQVEDAPETENAQEPEAAAVPPDAVAISSGASDVEVIHDTSALETVTEELIITESKEHPSVELEGSPPSPQDIASDLETCKSTTAPSDEESKTQEPETQTLLEDVPQPEDIAPEKPEGKDVLQLDEETDTKPCDAKVEHEENVLENMEGLPALTAVHVSSVNEEARTGEVLERTTCPEETQPVCVDLVEVSEEPKSEVNLCEQQETVEGDKTDLLSAAEIKVADHTFISHEVMSNLQDVSREKPYVVQEVLMSKTASEIEINDTIETATPLVLDDINQVAEPSFAVLTMRVPPVEIEVNHKVQVHLMDVDITSAQNAVDTVIQVGITEDKEVIDVCHESIQKVDNLLATAGVEEETTVEEIQVTVQEVMQHVTSNLLETPSKMATQHVEQAMEESVSMIEVCETDQKESVETEDEKVINDGTETAIERQEEEATVITENSGILPEQECLGGSEVPLIIPQSPEISVEDHKEDLEEAKPDKPEVCTAARDARTEELTGKGPNETTMEPLTSTQRQLATPGNAGLAVPQNTGVISSVGNLESPSSLSLEFKLNIQFAQAKASTWPSAAPVERIEPVKQVDVSEAGVQAEESAESVRQRDEGKKQTELNEVAVQATSITEPEADSHLIQRAVIASQPVLQDVGIQAVETIEPLEQIQSSERVIAEVQTVEVCQPARQEKRAVFLRKPLLSEAKKSWAFRQSEDENDQDVWLDAEEDIYPQQDMQASTEKVDERVKLQSESEEKDEAEPELEFEMACSLEAEDTESQRDAPRKETSEMESEGEDFTVALEDLGTSVSAVE